MCKNFILASIFSRYCESVTLLLSRLRCYLVVHFPLWAMALQADSVVRGCGAVYALVLDHSAHAQRAAASFVRDMEVCRRAVSAIASSRRWRVAVEALLIEDVGNVAGVV